MRSVPAWILPALACAWLLALFAAPLALRRGIAPVATVAIYQGSSILCHQRTERSFHVQGIQQPVCGRCLGLYAAGAAGAVFGWILRYRAPTPRTAAVRTVLALAALPIALSVGLEWVGAIDGSNVERFASALPLGAAAGWILQRVMREGPGTPLRTAAA